MPMWDNGTPRPWNNLSSLEKKTRLTKEETKRQADPSGFPGSIPGMGVKLIGDKLLITSGEPGVRPRLLSFNAFSRIKNENLFQMQEAYR